MEIKSTNLTLRELMLAMAPPPPAAPPCPGLTELALRVARRIQAGGAPDGNLVFSPLSVYAALALVAAGAGGDTLAELLGVLGAGSRDELAGLAGRLAGRALADRSRAGGPRVSFVSGVWYDKTRTLSPSFRDAAVQSFMAETRAADFREKVSTITISYSHLRRAHAIANCVLKPSRSRRVAVAGSQGRR